jgi:hypothetical protein
MNAINMRHRNYFLPALFVLRRGFDVLVFFEVALDLLCVPDLDRVLDLGLDLSLGLAAALLNLSAISACCVSSKINSNQFFDLIYRLWLLELESYRPIDKWFWTVHLLNDVYRAQKQNTLHLAG